MKHNPPIYLSGCLIPDSNNLILLLHRDNGKRNQWETPGGKIEPGETSEQAAIREIEEELGVKVQLTRKVGEGDFAEGDQPYHYTWFQAHIISGIPRLTEPQTFTELKYFSIDEINATVDYLSAGTKTLITAINNKTISV